ncbi:hypothetical protein WY02_03655 [Pseudonocardia sp. AL041005-10]|nr:helix-turn-helix domain-containing protein [Pseudonocardia sp. AL041005-10]ALE77691.1 hypothetical protein WY02_03655 [Pseudonocardia sp. AL041005-10]
MTGTRWLTTAQVAQLCNVRPATVRSWVRRGHVQRGPDGRVNAVSLLRYLDRQRTAPAAGSG